MAASTQRVFVQVWTEIDPALNPRIDRNTGAVISESGDQLYRVSPLGRTGVAAALAMQPASVTAFAIGAAHQEALRHALAAGATRAVALTFQTDEHVSQARTGHPGYSEERSILVSLADWFEKQKADLVIADRIAGLIAGQLGWSHLAGLDDLQCDSERLQARRDLGRGEQEIVSARFPAVVRLRHDSTRPPYISRARLHSVALETIRMEELKVTHSEKNIEVGQLQQARIRTRIGRQSQPASSRGNDRLAALIAQPALKRSESTSHSDSTETKTPAEMAEEAVRYLSHHNLLPLRSEK